MSEPSPHSLNSTVLVPEAMLEDKIGLMTVEIRTAAPKVEWQTYIPEKQYGVLISLPYDCTITATLTYLDDTHEQAEIYVDMFQVNDRLQGQGIGTRLMQALIHESMQYGAISMRGHVTSLSALKTRARIFGPANLHFYDHVTRQKLNISAEQAMASERVDFDVVVDLRHVDTESWAEVSQ